MYKMKVMAIAREVGSRLIATIFIRKYNIITSEILLYFIEFQLGLQTALDGLSADGHSHEIDDVNGLQDALDGKASIIQIVGGTY